MRAMARPPLSESKPKVLYVRLTESDHKAFHALADKFAMTTSEYVRQVLADHLVVIKAEGLDQ
jgi:hypothetical protein